MLPECTPLIYIRLEVREGNIFGCETVGSMKEFHKIVSRIVSESMRSTVVRFNQYLHQLSIHKGSLAGYEAHEKIPRVYICMWRVTELTMNGPNGHSNAINNEKRIQDMQISLRQRSGLLQHWKNIVATYVHVDNWSKMTPTLRRLHRSFWMGKGRTRTNRNYACH